MFQGYLWPGTVNRWRCDCFIQGIPWGSPRAPMVREFCDKVKCGLHGNHHSLGSKLFQVGEAKSAPPFIAFPCDGKAALPGESRIHSLPKRVQERRSRSRDKAPSFLCRSTLTIWSYHRGFASKHYYDFFQNTNLGLFLQQFLYRGVHGSDRSGSGVDPEPKL